jgi:hypothetical protein
MEYGQAYNTSFTLLEKIKKDERCVVHPEAKEKGQEHMPNLARPHTPTLFLVRL